MQMRSSIKIGAKNGIKDKITARELLGLLITYIISSTGITKNMVTGKRSC